MTAITPSGKDIKTSCNLLRRRIECTWSISFHYHAYTSASSDEPYDPSMEYQFIIRSKHGRDMRKYNPLEREIIFRRGTRFLIKKREGNTIYLEEM